MKGQILSLSHKIITRLELSQVLETTGSPVVKYLLISDRSNTELNTNIKNPETDIGVKPENQKSKGVKPLEKS